MDQHTLRRLPAFVSTKILLVGVVVLGALVIAARVKGWSLLPRQPLLGGQSASASRTADWCNEHGVPESLCVICHPELKDKLLWCREHGLPEDLCTICHPERADQFVLCSEHGLPQSHCPQCSPAFARSARELPQSGDADATRSRPSLRPDPTPARSKAAADTDQPPSKLSPVRLASRRIAQDAGIEVATARLLVISDTVTGNGMVTYNANRYAEIHPRVEGILRDVQVDVGDQVRRGDVLARVDSAELGRAKADYLANLALVDLAQKNVDRLESLAQKGITAEKDLLEAETRSREVQVNLARSRQVLLTLGVTPRQIDRFVTSGEPDSVLEIVAPQDGVVVERRAVEGEAVQPTSHLFSVADLATMWVTVDVLERDLLAVRVGQPVVFQVSAFPSREFPGKLTWVSPEINERTHTVQARVVLENSDGLLRAHMFGRARIEASAPRQALLVPKTSVQTHQGTQVVFVKQSDTVYKPRTVQVKKRSGDLWEIESGLQSGEAVVTTGSFLFKTELDRGAIGSGCCAE